MRSNPQPIVKLFQPAKIGTMELRNRIVMPAMGTNYATPEGFVTDTLIDHYEARARGGVGLVIIEVTCVHAPVGKAIPNQLVIDDDKYIPGLTKLASAIRKHGARAALQLYHAGNSTKPEITGMQPVAPSAVARPGYPLPHPLSVSEIEHIIELFAAGAARAQQAGFDGIEVHGAHCFLGAQFLSRAWNKRQDDYGTSLQNRARFLVSIFKAIRERVGRECPVWCRLNGQEYGIDGGITLDETIDVSSMLQNSGCDGIHVSCWGQNAHTGIHRGTMYEPLGHFAHLAAAVKRSVSIPVIAVGRMNIKLGEQILNEGKADLIAFGRPLLADPELPSKVAANRLEDITPCLACNTCADITLGTPPYQLRCAVNASLGREREYLITPSTQPRKILVIGGGPAGMEAARIARLQSHEVVLYERQPVLGGKLILAAIPPGKGYIRDLTEYLTTQLRKTGVNVKLNTEVTRQAVQTERPDAVIVAAGGKPLSPDIPGVDKSGVVMADDVLAGKALVGKSVVIIGGELVGCELADFLAEQGKKVIVTRRGPEMATKMPRTVRMRLLARLQRQGVDLQPSVKYIELSDSGLIIERQGRTYTLFADTVILAIGYSPDRELYERLKTEFDEIYLAGDCAESKGIIGAIADGAHIGRKIGSKSQGAP